MTTTRRVIGHHFSFFLVGHSRTYARRAGKGEEEGRWYDALLAHHHLHKLLVVDLTVAIHVGLADHLVHLLVCQLLAEVGHDVAQLRGGDEAVAVLVEHAERLLDLLLRVGVLHLARHQRQELGEVDGAAAVLVHLVDHVLQLRLGGVLAERAHDGAELLGGDGAVAILVKEGKGLLELGDLLVGQLIRHGCCGGV
ncbi:calmodulin, putative [Leishmania tarentolae]|uniref:Calmodulin, putative n=1 Tax=Leishmania tarentolae TaxID=5689 RepID=A0A640KF37_LEITA|nr:calmodulin, putative [Leishmania tarentolae]